MSDLTPVLTDAETLRKKIHQKMTEALSEVFPLNLKSRTLELKDVRVHDKDYSSDQQKRALLSGASLQNPIKGTLVLKGADGNVIDEAKDFTLVHVPYLTNRHTIIADGTEYQFANQLRRKPGVYTQRADNGELHTIFNLGKGKNFDLGFNESKGTFHLQYGTSNIPLYPVLRGLGVTHETIAHHLGEGVAKENQAAHGHQIENAIGKLYQKLEHPAVYNANLPHVSKVDAITKRYAVTTLDPEVTDYTLGKPHDKVTTNALLDAAKKILAVHKGNASVDDTDSLSFKTFHSADDFLAERIKLTARAWAPKARMALTGKTKIREALRPAPFSDAIRKFVTTSSLTAVPSGINPLELLDHAVKVTSLGEGGISNDRAIPYDARMTHSTHFGALDPIRSPESFHVGVDIRASLMAQRDDNGNLYTTVRDTKTGKIVALKAGDLSHHVVAFPNQNLKGPVKAFVKGDVATIPGSRVTHEMMHVSHQYSPATSLIPMIHNIQGNRAIMGSKMGTQALPLLEREVPFVQVKSPFKDSEGHETSFEDVYGHMTVPTSPIKGIVEKIENGYVWIRPHTEKTAISKGVPPDPTQLIGIMQGLPNDQLMYFWDNGVYVPPTNITRQKELYDHAEHVSLSNPHKLYGKHPIGHSDTHYSIHFPTNTLDGTLTSRYRHVNFIAPHGMTADQLMPHYQAIVQQMGLEPREGVRNTIHEAVEQFQKVRQRTKILKILGYATLGTTALAAAGYGAYKLLHQNQSDELQSKTAEDRPVKVQRQLGPHTFNIELERQHAHHDLHYLTSHTGHWDYGNLPGYKGPDGDSLDFFVGDHPNGKIFSYDKQKNHDGKGWHTTDTKYVVGLKPHEADKFHHRVEEYNQVHGGKVRMTHPKEFRDWEDLQQHIDKTYPHTKTAFENELENLFLEAHEKLAEDRPTIDRRRLGPFTFNIEWHRSKYPDAKGNITSRSGAYDYGNHPKFIGDDKDSADFYIGDHSNGSLGVYEKQHQQSNGEWKTVDNKYVVGLHPEELEHFHKKINEYNDLQGKVKGMRFTNYTTFPNWKTLKEHLNQHYTKTAAIISFPKSEHVDLEDRLIQGKPIFTTRISDEYGIYHPGQQFTTPWGDKVEVKSVTQHTELKSHPFLPELTSEQYAQIKAHGPFDVVRLEKIATSNDINLIKVPYETNFPFQSKTYLHHTIQVKPGDSVEAGQRLGDSNFTKSGTLALGKNLLCAYVPYYGQNSNDAVVISEGCARKLTSEHMYREIYPLNSQLELSRDKHKTYYGNKFSSAQYAKLDETGVIKPGSKIDPKDPLIVGLTKTQIQGMDLMLGRISKALTKPYREVVLQWEHGTPGTVVEVFRNASQIAILIKTQEKMQIGDKLAPRYGNKGVVAKIVPDHEMLQDEKGRPIDLLMTSTGVISRINPAQIIETAIGKVVEKTGKPILYDNNEHKNAVKWAQELLKQHGIKDKEHLYDPIQKRKIIGPDGKGVLVGRQYTYKLFKSTDTNFAGHGVGPYDVNEQPLKSGGDESAKGIGKMELDALIAHGARNILQEAATIKSQKSDEFWKAIQIGAPLPTPKPSFAFNKFTAMLEGAGIKVDKRGSKFKLLPLTDKGVLERSRGAIENKKTLIAKNLKPERGGLFDPIKTGGPQGTLYSHIDLHEPIPHPMFVEPVRRLLGLSQKEFEQNLQDHGGIWFHDKLKKIDVDKKLTELHGLLPKVSGTNLDNAVKQIKYLNALKAENLKPHEAYMMSKVPVVPPVFRPILPEKRDPSQLMVADANKLYAHLLDTNDVLKHTALPSDLGRHRQMVFHAVGAVFGTHEPEDEKLVKQEVKGFLQNIAGTGSPKGGFFQRKLMRRTQDVSGRGTAVPDNNLGMDDVGIPEQMLWQMLDKLIVARLVRQGYGALQARELVDKKSPVAKEAMMAETRERPILLNRAPTLHRWSVLAAYPKPVKGKTIRVNPFIEKGMNLDYDGDHNLSSLFVKRMNLDYNLDLDTDKPGVSSYLTKTTENWWSLREVGEKMTARIKTIVPVNDGEKIYCIDLQDFPHQEQTHHQETKDFFAVRNIQVIAHDNSNQSWTWAPVSSWSIHRTREIEIVTLASGTQIHTDDDPRAIYGYDEETLQVVRRCPKDAVQNPTWTLIAHDISNLPSDIDTISDGISSISLTETLGRWFGTMIGDGWVDAADYVGLSALNDGIATDWRLTLDIIAPELTNKIKIYERTDPTHEQGWGDNRKFVINDKSLGQWLAPIIGQGAINKHLPPFFLRAPYAFRKGLFAGLMQTDGCISISKAKIKPQWMINFATSSNRLAREFSLLCQSLGIRASITPSDRNGKQRAYTITPSSVDLMQLNTLTVADSEAQQLWNQFFRNPPSATSSSAARKDKIPLPLNINKKLRQFVKNGSSTYISLCNIIRDQTGISRAKAIELLTKNPSLRKDPDPLLQRWIALVDNTSIRWDHVVSYEKTGIVEDGYDLTVPGYETFMNVEGVILSNTLQIHVPIQRGAIEDAKQMTLSNMLLSDQQRNKILAFPQHESIMGFTLASQAKPGEVSHHFHTRDEVLAAYRAGKIKLTDSITVDEEKKASLDEPEEICNLTTEEALSYWSAENVTGHETD